MGFGRQVCFFQLLKIIFFVRLGASQAVKSLKNIFGALLYRSVRQQLPLEPPLFLWFTARLW